MKIKINDNSLKIVMILLYLSLCFLVFLIDSNPIKQYELSLYAQIPDLGWVLILLILFGCFSIMILTFNFKLKKLNYIFSLALIILLNILIINLPNLFGYKYNVGSDILTHLGSSITILKTGFISSNFYPTLHILIANLNLVPTIPINTLINNLGSYFFILFIFFSYVLAKEIINKKIAIFVAFASTVIFFVYYSVIFPMGYSFILFPIIFYLYLKYTEKKTPETAIALLILSTSLVFFHPVAAFLLIVCLLSCEIGKKIYFRYYIKDKQNISNNNIKILYSIPLIVLISLFAWFWQNTMIWIRFINSIVDLFKVELTTTPLTDVASDNFSTLGLSYIEIMFLFIKMYGHVLIYGILFLMVLFWILKRKPLEKNNNPKNLFLISFLTIILSGLAIIDLIQPLTSLSSGRLIYLPLTFLPFFAGLSLYAIFSNQFKMGINSNKLLSILVLTVFLTSSIIGIISLYPSPITYRATPSITSEHFDGVKWLMNHYNKGTKMVNIRLNSERFNRISDAVYGTSDVRSVFDRITYISTPDHFNYTNNSNFGENFQTNGYLITREKTTLLIYQKLYPQLNRFNETDFLMLNQDSSVNKIYENGEIENWYVT